MYKSISEKINLWEIDAALSRMMEKINNATGKIVDIHYFPEEKGKLLIVVVFEV